jgi:hypothetical protein
MSTPPVDRQGVSGFLVEEETTGVAVEPVRSAS